jgi:hypothetical protein
MHPQPLRPIGTRLAILPDGRTLAARLTAPPHDRWRILRPGWQQAVGAAELRDPTAWWLAVWPYMDGVAPIDFARLVPCGDDMYVL